MLPKIDVHSIVDDLTGFISEKFGVDKNKIGYQDSLTGKGVITNIAGLFNIFSYVRDTYHVKIPDKFYRFPQLFDSVSDFTDYVLREKIEKNPDSSLIQ